MARSPQQIAAALAGRPAFWALVIAILFSWPIVRAVHAVANLPPPRPVLGALGEISLVDQYGARLGTDDLRGKVWVLQVFRASEPAPAAFAAMSELQHRSRGLGEAFHLVSLTVDPERDDRRTLARVARRHRASRRAWSFVRGSVAELHRALGADMAIDVEDVAPEAFERLTLIDRELRIRGFYDLAANDAVDLVLRDAGLVVNRGE